MVQFPVGENRIVAVIEPGNLDRMRNGKPLRVQIGEADVRIHWSEDLEKKLKAGKLKAFKIPVVGGEIALCYTPDMDEFQRLFMPLMPMSAETLSALLETCLKRSEVMR